MKWSWSTRAGSCSADRTPYSSSRVASTAGCTRRGWRSRPCADGDTGPMASLDPTIAARLKRDAQGLVPAVVQQHDTGEVLMLGWMDDEALHRTLSSGRATYWSRSRQEYWVKGDTSGNVQWVK